MFGSNKGIYLGYFENKLIGNILGLVDVITLGIKVETKLGSLYGSFDGYNDGKLVILFHGDSLGSTDGKVICSD